MWAFDEAAERAERAEQAGSPTETLHHALRAVELWRGGPDEILSAPWGLAPYERLRGRFVTMAVRAGELLLARHAPDRALVLAEQVFDMDPWSEAAHRLVVAAHLAARDHRAARRALDRYHEAMRELGVPPTEGTAMVERLLVAAAPPGAGA